MTDLHARFDTLPEYLHELTARYRVPGASLAIMHDGEIFDLGTDGGVVLEEQSRDELPMAGMGDDEVDMTGDAAGIPGIHRYHFELSALVRGKVGAPAVRLVFAVLVRVQDLNPRPWDWLAAGIQHPRV